DHREVGPRPGRAGRLRPPLPPPGRRRPGRRTLRPPAGPGRGPRPAGGVPRRIGWRGVALGPGRRGGATGHLDGEAGRAPARLPARGAGDGRQLQPDLGRGGGPAAGQPGPGGGGGGGAGGAGGGGGERWGRRRLARCVGFALAGVDPVRMLPGVIPATEKVLRQTGLGMDDLDVIEINEAFASVVLAWGREVEPDWERVNPNGGAIALGHPLGASGARIMPDLVAELERGGGRYGLQVMCEGGGMANATVLERLDG